MGERVDRGKELIREKSWSEKRVDQRKELEVKDGHGRRMYMEKSEEGERVDKILNCLELLIGCLYESVGQVSSAFITKAQQFCSHQLK